MSASRRRSHLYGIGCFASLAEYWDNALPDARRMRTALYPYMRSYNIYIGPFELQQAYGWLMRKEMDKLFRLYVGLRARKEQLEFENKWALVKTRKFH